MKINDIEITPVKLPEASLTPIPNARTYIVLRPKRFFDKLLKNSPAFQDVPQPLPRRPKKHGVPIFLYVSPDARGWNKGGLQILAEAAAKKLFHKEA